MTREATLETKQGPALNLGDLTTDVKNIIKERNQGHEEEIKIQRFLEEIKVRSHITAMTKNTGFDH